MFQIRKIKIKGFHSSGKIVEYDFANDNVTIVYGENGCGKTTLLQILNAVFSKDDTVLMNYKVHEITLLVVENGIETQISIKEKNVYLRTNSDIPRLVRKIEGYDWSELDQIQERKTLLIGVERNGIQPTVSPATIYEFINTQSVGQAVFEERNAVVKRSFAQNLAEYLNYSRKGRTRREAIDFSAPHIILNGSNVDSSSMESVIVECFNQAVWTASVNIQSALFATLSQLIEQEESGKKGILYSSRSLVAFERKLKKNLPLISIAIEEIPDGGQREILDLIKTADYEMIIDRCRDNPYLGWLMQNIVDNIGNEAVTYNSVLMLQKFFDQYTRRDKRMRITRDGISIEILKNGQAVGKHRINELSSGEKQLLTLLTCLFIDGKSRDIIFIDEPELSLNMKWQNEIIDLFEEYLPGTQVVMATHSPSIADRHTYCLRKLV
jgi:ABC-type lipoprotein export system ATPase subunit